MNKVTHREVTLLLVLFILLGGFLYYQLYFKPFGEKYGKLNDDIAAIRQDLATRKQAQAVLESQRTELDKLRQSTQKELSVVLPAYDQIEVISLIQQVFQPLVERYDISFNTTVMQQGYTDVYTVTVDTDTSYSDFRLLLTDLQHSPYVNRVVTSTLQNNEDSSAQDVSGRFTCQIEVEFLTLMQPLDEQDYPVFAGAGNDRLMGE